MRMTIDFHDNELKAAAYLTDKYAEIVKAMGAEQVEKKPRKGPYDITTYQTTHLNGGAIMGTDPQDQRAQPLSAELGRAEPVRDGRERLPAERRLQPDRHGRRAGLLGGRRRSASNISKIRGRWSMRRRAALRARLCRARARPLLAAGRSRRSDTDQQDFAQIEHGRYLATAADCAACHTVPDGGKPFAGGRPIETPFGNITSPNITPDRDTGIGAWSDEQFDNAVRKGIRPDGARLYPAMPYHVLHQDVARGRAGDPRLSQHRRAGAQSGRRQHAAVPVQHPRRDARLGLAVFQAGRIQARSATNRRNGIAAPSWCRGPAIAAPVTRRRTFSAATRPANTCRARSLQGWFAPEHHQRQRDGLGRWSVDDIVDLSQDRPQPHHRRHRPDGRGDRRTLSSHMTDSRSQGDRDLSQVAAGPTQTSSRAAAKDDPAMVAGGRSTATNARPATDSTARRAAAVPVARRIRRWCARTIRRR